MNSPNQPHIGKWTLKYAFGAAFTGILCCVAPALLFMFGLVGGVYAISFADFFYEKDGSLGIGAWILRVLAILIVLYGTVRFKKKQNLCDISPARKRKNLLLLSVSLAVFATVLFLSLEEWSSWYFDNFIVPAQQLEIQTNK
jgi:uncharacterized membrane protein YidH (DUF202 family)